MHFLSSYMQVVLYVCYVLAFISSNIVLTCPMRSQYYIIPCVDGCHNSRSYGPTGFRASLVASLDSFVGGHLYTIPRTTDAILAHLHHKLMMWHCLYKTKTVLSHLDEWMKSFIPSDQMRSSHTASERSGHFVPTISNNNKIHQKTFGFIPPFLTFKTYIFLLHHGVHHATVIFGVPQTVWGLRPMWYEALVTIQIPCMMHWCIILAPTSFPMRSENITDRIVSLFSKSITLTIYHWII